MGKSRSTDVKLERLRLLRDAAPSPEIVGELRKAIGDSSNHVVAAAAALTARFHFSELAADLVAAFEGLMIDPLKTDKTCAGKTAIVDAPESSALTALSALAVLNYDPRVCEQTAVAVEKRENETLRDFFAKKFTR